MSTTTQNVSDAGFCADFAYPRQAMRTEVKNFAKKAECLANEIISKNDSKPYTSDTVVYHHHHYSPYHFWPSPYYAPRPVVVVDGCRDDRRKKKDDAALLIGVAAAIVGGIAVYGFGSAISKSKDASRELGETHAFQRLVGRFQKAADFPKDQCMLFDAKEAADIQERIHTRIQDSASWDLSLRGGLVLGCGTALAGAIGAVPAAMTAGVVGSLVVGTGMLFKWGLDSSDKDNYRDAQNLKNRVHDLKANYQ